MDLTPWLDDLASRIDPDDERRLLADWLTFAAGRWPEAVFAPRRRRPAPPRRDWPRIPVNHAIADFDLMVLRELAGCSAILERGGGGLLGVRCNFGTGIVPSLFGAEIVPLPDAADTLPGAKPLGAAAALRLPDAGPVDLNTALGGRTLAQAGRFHEILGRHPLLARHIHLYPFDVQGPIDLAEMLIGSNLFYLFGDEPAALRHLLTHLTDVLLAFWRAWLAVAGPPPAPGHHLKFGYLFRGTCLVSEDSCMNLPPDLIAEYVWPEERRLFHELGGAAIHSCGRLDHWIHLIHDLPGCTAVNVGQPSYNDLERVFAQTIDRGLPLLDLDGAVVDAALARKRPLRGLVHRAG